MNEWDPPAQEDETQVLRDYLAILHRRIWYLILPAVVILTASVAYVMNLTPVYRSTGKILIEQQEIPEEWVQDMVTSFADQRIAAISQQVLTTANLTRLIEELDLFAEARRKQPSEVFVEQMRRNFSIDMISANSGRRGAATIAFSVSFDHHDPVAAQKVANEMVSLYLEENAETRAKSVADTTRFLKEEAERLDRELSGMEARIADFKEEYMGQLPEQQDLNLSLLQRAEQALQETRRQIESMEEREIYLESTLAQLQNRPASAADGSSSEPATDLRSLRVRYTSLSGIYAEDHPDLVRLRRQIEALQRSGVGGGTAVLEARLQSQRQELSSMQGRYSDDHPDIKRLRDEISMLEKQIDGATKKPQPVPDTADPIVAKIRADLNAAQSELRTLRKQEQEYAEKVRSIEQRIADTPRTEQNYQSLIRDRESLEAKYRDIRAKLSSARVSQSLEEERKGERFTLLEPPQLPEEPIKPDRLKLLFLGFAGSLFGGLGAVVAREVFDQGVRSSQAVSEATNLPVLAVVSRIETLADQRRVHRNRLLVVTAVVLCVVGAAWGVHVYYKPLDVLWYEQVQPRLESL